MSLSLKELYRKTVLSAKGKRLGRVASVLFDAENPVVVGFVVERPRFLWIFDRKDRFLTLDKTRIARDDLTVTGGPEAWDAKAAKRLGIDWDSTVVWVGMPVRTEQGTELGSVRDGLFNEETGKLQALGLSGGLAADTAVGVRDIPAALVRGYRDGRIVVANDAVQVETSGGAAAAAGKGAAVAKIKAGQAAKTAAAYGKSAAKVAAQSETGKKALGWLKAIRDDIVEGMGDADDK